MNYPTPTSGPFGLVWVIGFIGGILLLWALSGLVVPGKEPLLNEYGRKSGHYRRLRPHIRLGSATLGGIVCVIAVVLLIIANAAGVYLGLTGKILVAHLRATPSANSGNIPKMSVDLILYDQNGKPASENTYIVNGNELYIGGDIIEYKPFWNLLGFHSGYKVTLLEGRYSDSNHKTQVDDVTLNGGDDSIFLAAYQNGGQSVLATAAYKNGSTIPANKLSYNICASQDAIVPQPDNEPC